MSMNAVNPVVGASGPSAALPQVAPDIRNLLTQIAEAPGLMAAERTALVQATATASSIVNPDLRAAALRQVSGMGLYLSKTGDSGLPRWTVLTALRTYGLNLQTTAPKAASVEQNAQVAQQVAQQVAAAGANRGISVQQALQNTASQAAPVAAPSRVQAKNAAVVNMGGLGDSGSGAGGNAAALTTQILSKLV